MESKGGTALMTIDLSAAFNMADHNILLDVLHNKFGIRGASLNWFESYFRPRYCKVCIVESHSTCIKLDFSVPQGLCGGANIFNAYSSTLTLVIWRLRDIHGFADDHTLKDKFKIGNHSEERKCITNLENCAIEVKDWMDKNRLHMNDDKTEFIIFPSRQVAKKIETNCLNVNGTMIQKSEVIRYLGIWLDLQLNFKHHITMKCRVMMLNLQRIKMIWKYLTKDVANTLALSLVISPLDYCNAILVGLPDTDISCLQRFQNICTKTVQGQDEHESSTRCLLDLHWLLIWKRIQHKGLTFVHKVLNDQAPDYIKTLLREHQPRREGLRSDAQSYNWLTVLRTYRKTFATRSFNCIAPTWWNNLPIHLKMIKDTETFKKKLKTHL